ncbi:MAG: protein SCO1/2 [Glaciecola sp.]|jgi:protein SCO1/2
MLSKDKKGIAIGITLWLILIVFIFYVPLIPLTSDKQLDPPFLNENGTNSAVVFFGFRGCSNVCPMTLSILQRLLNSQQNEAYWPQIIFVDIDIDSSSALASDFAKKFHPSFVGYHTSPEELLQLSAKLGLNIQQQSSQIMHLGKTYLLHRKSNGWRLIKTYNPESFSAETLQKELSIFNS